MFVIPAIVVYTFFETTPLWALKNTLVLIVAGPGNGLLKVMYARPRPFWDYEEVENLSDCSISFGNPSGHAMLTFGCYLYLVVTITRVHTPRRWVVVAMTLIATALIVFVWFDRVYLGRHSWN